MCVRVLMSRVGRMCRGLVFERAKSCLSGKIIVTLKRYKMCHYGIEYHLQVVEIIEPQLWHTAGIYKRLARRGGINRHLQEV